MLRGFFYLRQHPRHFRQVHQNQATQVHSTIRKMPSESKVGTVALDATGALLLLQFHVQNLCACHKEDLLQAFGLSRTPSSQLLPPTPQLSEASKLPMAGAVEVGRSCCSLDGPRPVLTEVGFSILETGEHVDLSQGRPGQRIRGSCNVPLAGLDPDRVNQRGQP